MINPSVNKLVLVEVLAEATTAKYNGCILPIMDMYRTKEPGMRKMYLRYSIVHNAYYLKSV